MAERFNRANFPMTKALDLFAAAWLEQWVAAGGYVTVSEHGLPQYGYPEFSGSGIYTAVDDANRDAGGWRYQNYLFCDGQYHGRMKGLLDLLDTMPRGGEAILRHMISHGISRYYPASAKPVSSEIQQRPTPGAKLNARSPDKV